MLCSSFKSHVADLRQQKCPEQRPDKIKLQDKIKHAVNNLLSQNLHVNANFHLYQQQLNFSSSLRYLEIFCFTFILKWLKFIFQFLCRGQIELNLNYTFDSFLLRSKTLRLFKRLTKEELSFPVRFQRKQISSFKCYKKDV